MEVQVKLLNDSIYQFNVYVNSFEKLINSINRIDGESFFRFGPVAFKKNQIKMITLVDDEIK
jgi:hypothetical protein